MTQPHQRGAFVRAALAAACLFLIEAFAPHAHAEALQNRHHHHRRHCSGAHSHACNHHLSRASRAHHRHRVRIAVDVQTGAIQRADLDPFAAVASLFQPPVAAAQAQVERGIEAAGETPARVASSASAVLRYASRFVGGQNPTRFRGPWCAAFINMVLDRTGHRHSLSMRAIDALRDGYRVSYPRPGDIAVLTLGRHHHVTFFASWGGRGFYGLGGNQSHRVRLSSYPLNRVIAFVRPT